MELKQEVVKFKPKLFIKVKDKNGHYRINEEVPCHSFVKNFYLVILQQMLGPNARSGDNIVIKTTSATTRSDSTTNSVGYPASAASDMKAGVSDSTYGLVVGDGDTAWDVDDYILVDQLTNGIGAGYLSYGAQSTPVVSDVGDTRTVTINRSFYNNSATGITVKEVGWYWDDCYGGGGYSDINMVFRDVLETPIVLSQSEELNVELAISLTYPETIS